MIKTFWENSYLFREGLKYVSLLEKFLDKKMQKKRLKMTGKNWSKIESL